MKQVKQVLTLILIGFLLCSCRTPVNRPDMYTVAVHSFVGPAVDQAFTFRKGSIYEDIETDKYGRELFTVSVLPICFYDIGSVKTETMVIADGKIRETRKTSYLPGCQGDGSLDNIYPVTPQERQRSGVFLNTEGRFFCVDGSGKKSAVSRGRFS